MTKRIFCCKTEQPLAEAVNIMRMAKVRRLPVINAKKLMVGMLSLGDVAAKASSKRRRQRPGKQRPSEVGRRAAKSRFASCQHCLFRTGPQNQFPREYPPDFCGRIKGQFRGLLESE